MCAAGGTFPPGSAPVAGPRAPSPPCPAASASSTLLFVFPPELCWVNSNTLAWLQLPANFHWPGEPDSQSETEGKGPFPRLRAGAAADKSLTCYGSCLSSHIMSFAAHSKLPFLIILWKLRGVSLGVRFIGHITFRTQEQQMCQAAGKYPIFVKRFFAENFFPLSSALVVTESFQVLYRRMAPAFPMPNCNSWVQLIHTIWNWTSSLRLRLPFFKEKCPCPFSFKKFCLWETFLQGVNWLLINWRWWTRS